MEYNYAGGSDNDNELYCDFGHRPITHITYTHIITNMKCKCMRGMCTHIITNKCNLYNDCFVKRGAQNYLVDDDFQRTRLKLQARVNILPLKVTLNRINISSDNVCELCGGNDIETLEHFLF